MFWCFCLRILSCGLFGVPEEPDLEVSPVNTEVKYTFAIEDSGCSDEEDYSDCSDFVSSGSEDSCGSPWEVLEDLMDRF